VNGFTLLVLIVLAAAIPLAFRAGMLRERRDARLRGALPFSRRGERDDSGTDATAGTPSGADAAAAPMPDTTFASAATTAPAIPATSSVATLPAGASPATASGAAHAEATPASASAGDATAPLVVERARIIRVAEGESAARRAAARNATAEIGQLRDFSDDRRALLRALADARGATARYREIVVDLEDNAPPPLLGVAGAPDDLKLIVGVGPVLERMLLRMGIATYREIARWSDHDIDAVDARLPEFHGRIRRDGWVTQARALHQSKYGERP
jgi:predicted flap endonuclease-1-like 5' DNA nuclease